jgi:hypothetical protein
MKRVLPARLPESFWQTPQKLPLPKAGCHGRPGFAPLDLGAFLGLSPLFCSTAAHGQEGRQAWEGKSLIKRGRLC